MREENPCPHGVAHRAWCDICTPPVWGRPDEGRVARFLEGLGEATAFTAGAVIWLIGAFGTTGLLIYIAIVVSK